MEMGIGGEGGEEGAERFPVVVQAEEVTDMEVECFHIADGRFPSAELGTEFEHLAKVVVWHAEAGLQIVGKKGLVTEVVAGEEVEGEFVGSVFADEMVDEELAPEEVAIDLLIAERFAIDVLKRETGHVAESTQIGTDGGGFGKDAGAGDLGLQERSGPDDGCVGGIPRPIHLVPIKEAAPRRVGTAGVEGTAQGKKSAILIIHLGAGRRCAEEWREKQQAKEGARQEWDDGGHKGQYEGLGLGCNGISLDGRWIFRHDISGFSCDEKGL